MAQRRNAGDFVGATRAFVEAQAAFPPVVLIQDLSGIPFDSPELARASGEISSIKYGDTDGVDSLLLALLAGQSGNCRGAARVAVEAARSGVHLSIQDWFYDPAVVAADCYIAGGQPEQAVEQIRQSLRQTPGTLRGLATAVAAASALPSLQAEGQRWERELYALHDPISVAYALARAKMTWADPAGALLLAEDALRKLPELALLQYERSRALLALNRTTDAIQAYSSALASMPDYPFSAREFNSLVSARVQIASDNPALLALGARHFAHLGDVAQASAFARRAVAIWEGEAPADLQVIASWHKSNS
jgi:tetratricopeptide (TPR) repeat protein